MAKVEDVQTDQARKKPKAKDKSKKSKSKVKAVQKVQKDQVKKKQKPKDRSKEKEHKVKGLQTDQASRKQKSKDKSKKTKKSKPKQFKTGKTGLEKVEHQLSDPASSSHVQESQVAGNARTNNHTEQSQNIRKIKHESTTTSKPSKLLHISLVKISEYVQLAHEAAGRTTSTVDTKHIRKSINSGIFTALNEVQIGGTLQLQPEQAIERKVRDRVMNCIKGRSPYTTSRQVLVSLNNFIQALQVEVTAAQQSMEEQEQVPETHQDRGLGPGEVHHTRSQDHQGQWSKNTTFSRDVILIIWRRCNLAHLRAMNKDDFLGVVESTFQRVSPQVDSSCALLWLSHPTITDSGNVKVTIHTKDYKQLDMVTEDIITAWATILQDKVEQSNRVFEVLVPNFPVEPISLEDPGRKAETIDRLVRTNAATISSLTKPDDIRDIHIAKATGQTSWANAMIIVFNVCELANNVIENGFDWDGEHYRCEALGASKLLERCERCQLYTHTTKFCTNTLRCGKCAESHFTGLCKRTEFTCAVCSGPHTANSEACPARNAAREEVQKVRFAPEAEGDNPRLISPSTHNGKTLYKAVGLQQRAGMIGTELTGSHSHSGEVLERLRRLREEVVAFEEELTSGPKSQDRCSVSMDASHEKLETRSNVSGEVQPSAAIAGLPAASNGKREARKRKAMETPTDDDQPEMELEQKRIKREDSAFDQFGYQWTPGYYGPRE